jgi:hypothetical protein
VKITISNLYSQLCTEYKTEEKELVGHVHEEMTVITICGDFEDKDHYMAVLIT